MEHDGLNRKDAEWREAKEISGRSQTAEREGDMDYRKQSMFMAMVASSSWL